MNIDIDNSCTCRGITLGNVYLILLSMVMKTLGAESDVCIMSWLS